MHILVKYKNDDYLLEIELLLQFLEFGFEVKELCLFLVLFLNKLLVLFHESYQLIL